MDFYLRAPHPQWSRHLMTDLSRMPRRRAEHFYRGAMAAALVLVVLVVLGVLHW
jgi:hypothetical protein